MHEKLLKTGQLSMFGNGYESRDYIHIDDVTSALYLISTKKSQDTIFNVANGEEVTIKEVVEYFACASGIDKGNISFNGVIREGDPLNWKADISRIKLLGYKKTVDINEGIIKYVDWIKTL